MSPQQRGEQAFADERWEDAAEAFAEAYAATKDPRILYAQAQAVRKAGDCRRAIELYAAFLETSPPPQAERGARDNMAECAKDVAAQPVSEPEPDPDPDPESLPRRVDADPRRPWYADPWGGALAGVGVVGLVAGGAVYGVARADEREADRATTENDYLDRIDRASTLSRVGIALFVVGGAAIVGAVVRYSIVGTRGRRDRISARPGGLVVRF
jgi:hypothetical protein